MTGPTPCTNTVVELCSAHVLVSYPDPDSQQLRMDYITATWKVGLVSSCTNFCPAPPECWGDQSDLRYALIAYSSYQSKLLVMAARLTALCGWTKGSIIRQYRKPKKLIAARCAMASLKWRFLIELYLVHFTIKYLLIPHI